MDPSVRLLKQREFIEDTRKNLENLALVSSNKPETSRMHKSEQGSTSAEHVTIESKGQSGGVSTPSVFKPPENWANAPEFIPKNFYMSSPPNLATDECDPFPMEMTYAQALQTGNYDSQEIDSNDYLGSPHPSSLELCPYAMVGECRYGLAGSQGRCALVHGEECEFCGKACLHPFDPNQREAHHRECIKQHEKDMEHSFAVARSTDKTCGVCMEVVMEKSNPGEQRFGILPSCNHCFCLSCIRRWRNAKQFENKIIRACPECRITSDFVCPSRYWVETKEEKEKLINNYKVALSNKACRYYKNGKGECPFGNKCFYQHALPNGQIVDIGPPKRKPRLLRGNGAEVSINPSSIWDFLEEWEMSWMDIDEFMDMLEDEESDFSEEFDLDEYMP